MHAAAVPHRPAEFSISHHDKAPASHQHTTPPTPDRNTAKMPREAEPSLNEKAFVLQAIEDKKRLDGREFDEYRPLELTFGDEHGVADVKLGKTR